MKSPGPEAGVRQMNESARSTHEPCDAPITMHVVIAGAGPCGLSLSLVLAQEGINVTLVDKEDTVITAPRAAHLMAPAVQILRRAGILDEVRRAGFIPGAHTWRTPDGTAIVSMDDFGLSKTADPVTVLPIGMLSKLMLSHVEKNSKISLKWGHRVIDAGQDDHSAWISVKKNDGTEEKISGDFVCGCDGATSQVRKSVLGERNFPGKTWDYQLVAANVRYPFEKFGYDDMNTIIHPDDCHIVARLTQDGLWRVSYQQPASMTLEDVIDNQPAHFEKILPGHPKPGEYNLTNQVSPYKMHQRCAETFHVGRICLAADAAHLVNPWGGLGLTGGFADTIGLAECLVGIAREKADMSILDRYDAERRAIYHNFINPISSGNFHRATTANTDKLLENDPFLSMCAAARTDAKVEEKLQKLFSVPTRE
ncbi:MAG: hypothetical protein Q9227_001194 [Pyrenula ochraceoflavens]